MRAFPSLLAVCAVAILAVAAPAFAGDLTVEVKTPAGTPVANAVVTIQPSSGGAVPTRYDQPLRLAQHNQMFEPFILLVPLGAQVSFPNQDLVRHQVYSFSITKKFELKLYGHDESRSVTFDKAGVVAVGCNIHDNMTAFIKVADTPYAARTDAAGHLAFKDLPAGAAVVRVWHPYAKTPAGEQRFDMAIPKSGGVQQAVSMDLRPFPKHVMAN